MVASMMPIWDLNPGRQPPSVRNPARRRTAGGRRVGRRVTRRRPAPNAAVLPGHSARQRASHGRRPTLRWDLIARRGMASDPRACVPAGYDPYVAARGWEDECFASGSARRARSARSNGHRRSVYGRFRVACSRSPDRHTRHFTVGTVLPRAVFRIRNQVCERDDVLSAVCVGENPTTSRR